MGLCFMSASTKLVIVVTLALRFRDVCPDTVFTPCPDFFQYELDGADWVGFMRIPSSYFGKALELHAYFSTRVQVNNNYYGKIVLLTPKNLVARKVQLGRPLRYRVEFPFPNFPPQLTRIEVNGEGICEGPPLFGARATSIKLNHALYLSEVSPGQGNGYQLQEQRQQQRNFNQQHSNNRYENYDEPVQLGFRFDSNTSPSFGQGTNFHQQNYNNNQGDDDDQGNDNQNKRNSNHKQNNYNVPQYPNSGNAPSLDIGDTRAEINRVCGKARVVRNNHLAVNSHSTSKGDWPWLVAIYITSDSGLKFVCSGSLVSHTAVITAAHCTGNGRTFYNVDKFLLILGRFNINNWAEGGTNAQLSEVIVHPNYRNNKLGTGADIAILRMKSRVEFSDLVVPLCLWYGRNDLRDIAGLNGIVVGWGKDETGAKTTPEPRLSSVPIVDRETCLFSHNDFREIVTSDRMFCAGARDGSGPCNGDSGGALMLQQNHHWALRGIVSISLLDKINRECDLNEYIVYTDVPKFHGWIVSYVFP